MPRHAPRRRRVLTVVTAALAAAALVPLSPATAQARVGSPVRVAGSGTQVLAVSNTGRYVQMFQNGRPVRYDRRTRTTGSYTHSGWATMSGRGSLSYVVTDSRAYRETTNGSSLAISLGTGWYAGSQPPRTTSAGTLVGVQAVNPNRAQTAPFVWDLTTRTPRRLTVSTSRNGGVPALSSNGKYATYVSYASSEPTGCTRCGGVYRRTLATNAVRLVSVDRTGHRSDSGLMHSPVVSDDGRYVYFLSNATDLVAGYTTSRWRVYVRDLVGRTTRFVSSASAPSRDADARLSLSADGTRLVFLRRTRTGSGYGDQVFLYDRTTRRNTLVSTGGPTPDGEAYAAAISGAGTRIVFSTLATNVGRGGSGTFIAGVF